jgi:methyltransferase
VRRGSFLALLGLYGAWRLGELALSARHERALERRGVRRGRDRGFPWMIAAHVTPFALAPVETRWRRRAAPRALSRLALALLGGAAALRLAALASLGPSWSVRVRSSRAMRVVARGPYRFVRHPNYAAVIVELAALPLAGGAYATALVASALDAVALALRIPDEERALAASPEWRRSMTHKPRFLPKL